ncbi:acyl-CoA dehydrogenase [Oligoflexaceae bacterium]|nr:acyl-CoA dehydrogenase [Oligoflexaceae bacterium]
MSEFESVNELETYLGNPFNPESRINFKSILQDDIASKFPGGPIATLNLWGLHKYFIPQSSSGRFCSVEESVLLLKSVSSRDLTTAVAYFKTMLATLPVWISGSEKQKQEASRCVASENLFSLALTEEGVGSDFNNITSSAIKSEDKLNLHLSASKWLINNAQRASFFTTLVKEKSENQALSLLLLNASELEKTGFVRTEKIKTLGVRGADISGFEVRDALISSDCVLGKSGTGLQTLSKTFQVSRIICTGLSLGAVNSALKIVSKFSLERSIYGAKVKDLQLVQYTLARAYLDYNIIEECSRFFARSLHSHPEMACMWSSVAKYLIPTMSEDIISNLSRILGARHFLEQDNTFGMFQKIMRDNLLVSLFDGSTQVNLSHIAAQLPMALNSDRKAVSPSAAEPSEVDFESLRYRLSRSDPVMGAHLNQIPAIESLLKNAVAPPNSIEIFDAARSYCLSLSLAICIESSHALKKSMVKRMKEILTGQTCLSSKETKPCMDQLLSKTKTNEDYYGRDSIIE